MLSVNNPHEIGCCSRGRNNFQYICTNALKLRSPTPRESNPVRLVTRSVTPHESEIPWEIMRDLAWPTLYASMPWPANSRSSGRPFKTLNILNCFKDYKRRIHTSYHILGFVEQKIKFTMEQLLSILFCQCNACWWPGDLRSQGTSWHDIDQISRNISSLASEELTYSLALFNTLTTSAYIFFSLGQWITRSHQEVIIQPEQGNV